MTKRNFYDFGLIMANDSNLLFNNNSLHNSVYLGAFVLEAYVKILFINNGAITPNGQRANSYGGHINDSKMVERLQSIYPNVFSSSILEPSDDKYPTTLLSSVYDINYRYEVDKWIDESTCQNIQDEVLEIYDALNDLRITIGI
ncbi:MAG: hypothetical protein DRG78_04800 [Epsilonproteobacteria bacterium]|nr:MAG: hypothetical protein DRG78_04800 [Campylobacterota bacterium]